MTDIKAKALALYKPPFRFVHGYIYDAENRRVADRRESSISYVGDAAFPRWAKKLQDTVGELLAEALTQYWDSAVLAGSEQAAPAAVEQEPVGGVLHIFEHDSTAAIQVYDDSIKVGDTLYAHPAPNEAVQDLAVAIHYPEHWDTAAYPTLESALVEVYHDFKCQECASQPHPATSKDK